MKYVLIYSGGMDSTVLLYDLLHQGAQVHALSVDYGQRHRRELEMAQQIAQRMQVEHRVVDLRSLLPLFGNNSLTDWRQEVPEGHYTEPSMKQTVVPNRNMLMLAVAGSWAIALKADGVAYAAHAGDHAIYPDCRPAFADKMAEALELADWHTVKLHRPYVPMDKAQIVKRGAELGVPFEQTWSCYKGMECHCGQCGTCVERREAFEIAGIPDPTIYGANQTNMPDWSANES